MIGKLGGVIVLVFLASAPRLTAAAEVVFLQNRSAYWSGEPIALAVSGLSRGQRAALKLEPAGHGLAPVEFRIEGDGSTVRVEVPPLACAPSEYRVTLDGREAGRIKVSSGVNVSTMLLSQTVPFEKLGESGANFVVGNAFEFGLIGPDGMPDRAPRGKRSRGLERIERAVAANLPTLIYMYWTGYVTHKPWGTEKSWAEPTMVETMRLFNFHVAQRLRRYAEHIISVGTLDEPGLAWGRTPAGGMASGFPNWDERAWYESRGWRYTDDPASRPDRDWMKYMAVRCGIIKEANAQAARDIKAVWPGAVFSTDLYAPHAVMDGTDPMNQEVNDVPCTHVFLDWGIGRSGTTSAMYLEKAHDPSAKIAHAMNGQLFGATVRQPTQRDTYRLMLGCLFAAGLDSNWWLNTRGMSMADLASVNEPGLRIGPLFRGFAPDRHDVAVLWSFGEVCMRQKPIAAERARKSTGEQIKLMIADMPENSATKPGQEYEVHAYNVGGNYKWQVLTTHHALLRSGYPADIVDERLLGRGALKRYRTLVVVGQTHPLAPDAARAVDEFVSAGGSIVVDRTTTVRFKRATTAELNLEDGGFQWEALFTQDPKSFKTPKEASYFKTNYFMDDATRRAIAPMKAAMSRTESKPAASTGCEHLLFEHHWGGEGELYFVVNAREELPAVADTGEYPVYNYVPCTAEYLLTGLRRGSVAYMIEGPDWKRVTRLTDPSSPQRAKFAPGETKLCLVAPREVSRLGVSAEAKAGALRVSAALANVKMPWPLVVTVLEPGGGVLYRVYRATGALGEYTEVFPLGSNARPGSYVVKVESPVGPLSADAQADVGTAVETGAAVAREAGPVRVIDEGAIRAFLAARPKVVIALGRDSQRRVAESLRAGLARSGVRAIVLPEKKVFARARYPRVFDPYVELGGRRVKCTEDVRRKLSRPWERLSTYSGADQLPPALPEAYSADRHLVLLGDSAASELVAALQASELLLETVDEKYPGPGRAVVEFAWSPFGLEKNVVFIGASDNQGLRAGAEKLLELCVPLPSRRGRL